MALKTLAVAATALATALAGCSAGTNTHSSPPTSLEYDVTFPSTAAAVGADTIQTFVFSRSTPGTDCPSLLVARQSGSDLPASLAQTTPVPLCTMLGGTKGQVPAVAYGDVSLLIVAQRAGADYFTGCTLATISATSAPVAVQLQPASATTPIPPTNCQSVSAHCANPPTCTVGADAGP